MGVSWWLSVSSYLKLVYLPSPTTHYYSSLEYSHHEFRETGFSPILAGDLYCEEDGDDEELEHCYIFDDDVDAVRTYERVGRGWGLGDHKPTSSH